MKIKNLAKRKVAYFLSNNMNKFREAARILEKYGIIIVLIRLKKKEIQNDSIEKIAKVSAEEAAEELNLPVVTEDAGLFIDALNGFPGPYSSFTYRTIGVEGILKLMSGVENRKAKFKSAVAYAEPSGESRIFSGGVSGEISVTAKGDKGFGFDPIFQPYDYKGRTFAELDTDEKNAISHRGLAFRKFAEWYISKVG